MTAGLRNNTGTSLYQTGGEKSHAYIISQQKFVWMHCCSFIDGMGMIEAIQPAPEEGGYKSIGWTEFSF